MPEPITIFMCGDVMTGRGIDQALPYPSNPVIYEPYMKSAAGYLRLAEEANGEIPNPVDFSYIWGDALKELEKMNPDLRVINLETTITKSEDWEDKGINYRMNPENIACIKAARIDFCSLANNHILDWGYAGLIETIETFKNAGIRYAGAGRDKKEAETQAVIKVKGKGRVILFSFGDETSGISFSWAATEYRAGVNMLKDLSDKTVGHIKEHVRKKKKEGDIAVASIHWGGNWGYEISREQRTFAHGLIEEAGIDIIHGHSSHHVKGIEVYEGKLIIYGCGDFINDYEGIGGYEYFRGDLGLMYFLRADPTSGRLVSLQMTPTQIKRLRVNRASKEDALWMSNVLNREGKNFGTSVKLEDDILKLQWD